MDITKQLLCSGNLYHGYNKITIIVMYGQLVSWI